MPPISPETHLDADTLTALAEHSLLDNEKEIVFSHLAECEVCREYLRVHAELTEFNWHAGTAPHKPSYSPWLSRSAGIAAIFAFALWLLLSPQFQRRHASIRDHAPLHAKPQFTIQRRPWGAASLQKLSIRDHLAARNTHRFSNEVMLTTVSFRKDPPDELRLPGLNQIKLETALGERWVSVFLPLTIYN